MIYVSEAFVADNLTVEHMIPDIEAMYGAMSCGKANNFPVVRTQLGHANAVFGFKSGFDRSRLLLGVKAGGYWPGNLAESKANHQSTVLLIDPDSGVPTALVRGNLLTGMRTAAASAISIKYLARRDSAVLGILGAGAQAELQIQAALVQRPFRRLLIADREPAQSEKLAGNIRGRSLEVSCCPAEAMARRADVIITVTPSTRAVISADWIRPGTHLACMGADTAGKQEIDPGIFPLARAFCDEISQSTTIGECQHATKAGLIRPQDIIPIGDVIEGSQPGRTSPEEITIFDSTGVGLQDVVAASIAVRVARDLDEILILD